MLLNFCWIIVLIILCGCSFYTKKPEMHIQFLPDIEEAFESIKQPALNLPEMPNDRNYI
jgi:hypothetical protein